MRLYHSPGACSLSPRIALHEAGLAYDGVLAPTKWPAGCAGWMRNWRARPG